MAKGYEAHEAMVADVKMWVKMGLLGLLVCLAIQFVIVAWAAKSAYREQFTFHSARSGLSKTLPFSVVWKYYFPGFTVFGRESKVTLHDEIRGLFGNKTSVTTSQYKAVLNQYLGGRMAAFENSVKTALAWSWFVYLLLGVYIYFFCRRSTKISDVRFLRGAVKVTFAQLRAGLEKTVAAEDGQEARNLKICGLDFPRDSETKHILIMGTTGTGKSVLMNQVVRQLVQRVKKHKTNDKMIVYDVKGEFLSKHYIAMNGAKSKYDVADDLIFYPFDKRCLRWSFFNEIRSDADFDVYSKIIFTPPKEAVADPFWLNAAKDVFVAGLRYLHMMGQTRNADIWNFFCQGLEDIHKQLSVLPLHHQMALKHIDTKARGPGASVISVLTEKISFFRYLSGIDGPFSFRDFVTSSKGQNLFLLNIKNYATIFRPLMTFAFDVMIRETLSLPDTNKKDNRRIWFCIDEIGSLDQISVLFDLLTVARSKGGCLLVANQDLGRIEDIYGRANRRTFYNNFNTNFILRLNDPDTADFLSQSIGEREVVKVMASRQMSPKDSGDRKSFSDQDKTEKLILPSEFINQPDFHCVIKVSGHGITEGVIPRVFFEPVATHFQDLYADRPLAAPQDIPEPAALPGLVSPPGEVVPLASDEEVTF